MALEALARVGFAGVFLQRCRRGESLSTEGALDRPRMDRLARGVHGRGVRLGTVLVERVFRPEDTTTVPADCLHFIVLYVRHRREISPLLGQHRPTGPGVGVD